MFLCCLATCYCLQAAVQKLIAAAAAQSKSNSAATIRWWEGSSSTGVSGNNSSSSSSWMDQSLLLALSVAGDKLSRNPADADAAASAVHIICSSINSAAADGHQPSDRWLQQAWQLLQHALGIAADSGSLPDELAQVQVDAAYATAVTFGFVSTESSDLMSSAIGKPPGFKQSGCGYCTSYYNGNSWLQWLRVLAAPDVLASEYQLCAKLASFCPHNTEWSALEDAVRRGSPQLQAEGMLVLGTPAMMQAMFEIEETSSADVPRAACAGMLGALAEGLSRAADDSSSSSTSGGGALCEVSSDVLLQLAAAMPVLLRSIATVVAPSLYTTDFNYTGPEGYGYDTNGMLEAACKLVVLAQHIAAYTSSIAPVHASTAQLVQLDQALDAFLPAVDSLAEAMGDSHCKYRSMLYEAAADWPRHADRQVFSLLVERLTNQQQPPAELVPVVAAGLAARCSSASEAAPNGSSDVSAAALALHNARLPDLSAQELAGFLKSVVTVAEYIPAAGDKYAVSSLVESWRKQLPAYIVPVVVAALEALPTEDASSAAGDADNWAALKAAEASITEAKATAEAVTQILGSIKQLRLPAPSVTMELMQHLLPRLFEYVDPRKVGDVLSFVAQQQQRRFTY
jgi:hypothetical protein